MLGMDSVLRQIRAADKYANCGAGLQLPAHVITMDAALVPTEVDGPAGKHASTI